MAKTLAQKKGLGRIVAINSIVLTEADKILKRFQTGKLTAEGVQSATKNLDKKWSKVVASNMNQALAEGAKPQSIVDEIVVANTKYVADNLMANILANKGKIAKSMLFEVDYKGVNLEKPRNFDSLREQEHVAKNLTDSIVRGVTITLAPTINDLVKLGHKVKNPLQHLTHEDFQREVLGSPVQKRIKKAAGITKKQMTVLNDVLVPSQRLALDKQRTPKNTLKEHANEINVKYTRKKKINGKWRYYYD